MSHRYGFALLALFGLLAIGRCQDPPPAPARPGLFDGRTGALREKLLAAEGGTQESEAAVVRGLIWLARHQQGNGRWKLDGPFPDKGNANDEAATGLGLLPFLGAGKTHKLDSNNTYKMVVDKGLRHLLSIQDKRTGAFSRDMYAHALCAMAISEAYGMTQDAELKKPAQMALNFIVAAQHAGGGWRYAPGQDGDTSVTGWQVMALKTGLAAGLDVPARTFRKAQDYLYAVVDEKTEGYGYTDGRPTKSMTAVALLCRQFLQGWSSANPRLIKGVDNYIKANPPKENIKDVYYYYYAAQVMHHYGGDDWKNWNKANRDLLINTQDKDPKRPEAFGSWTPAGDQWGVTGGRLMVTSLNILSLEVYYRHPPLYSLKEGS
jgi:hypothetical protein